MKPFEREREVVLYEDVDTSPIDGIGTFNIVYPRSHCDPEAT